LINIVRSSTDTSNIFTV